MVTDSAGNWAQVLKALEDNQSDFVEAGLAVLAGLGQVQVRSVMLSADQDTMDRFFARAGIPDELRPPFRDEFQKRRQK